jgi:nucleoside-diphosphate-sugar epimerase
VSAEQQRVVITGGSGKLGRAVVAEFARSGYAVTSVDRARPTDLPTGVHFLHADLTDYGQAVEALTYIDDTYGTVPAGSGQGVHALVHLAAIPAPGLIPNAATYSNNTAISYNLFSAARLAGIRRVVFASSETLLGTPFDSTPPPYFPVDEEYPVRPQSSYSLSKSVDEEIARHFARWSPDAAFLGLRFSNVMEPADYLAFPSYNSDPRLRSWNAWGYIDARDGAIACRLAVESEVTGAESGTDTLLSIEKARRLLGFEPAHSWRDEV